MLIKAVFNYLIKNTVKTVINVKYFLQYKIPVFYFYFFLILR